MGLFSARKYSAVLPCEASLVYEILIDYDSYCEWLPPVAKSKLLAKEGDLALAEFELSRPHEDKFVVECIHTKNTMVLSRTIGGKIPVAQFQWTLEPVDAGHCRVEFDIQAKFNLNRFLPSYSIFLDAKRCFAALQARTAIFSLEWTMPIQDGEKIFDLMDTEQGLVCWFKGKKYYLTPASEGNHDQGGH